jgi:spermidine synthase
MASALSTRRAYSQVITKTFLEVFPGGTAWLLRFNIDTPVLGLMGGLPTEHYSQITSRPSRPQGIASERPAACRQLRNGLELFGCFLASTAELRAFANFSEINADDRPLVVFRGPRLNYRRPISPSGVWPPC